MSTESIGSTYDASNKQLDRPESQGVEWKGRSVCEQDDHEDIQKPNFFYYRDPISGVYHKLIAVQKGWVRQRCHHIGKGISHTVKNVGHAVKKGAIETGHFCKSAAHKTGEFVKKHDGGGGGVSATGPSVPLGPPHSHPVPSQNTAPPRTTSNPYKPKSAFTQNPTQIASYNPQNTPPSALPKERLFPGGPQPQGQFPHRTPHFVPGKENHFEVRNPLVGQPSMQVGGTGSNVPNLDPNQLLQNPNANPYTRGFDEGHIIRAAIMQQAEKIAMEQRYSNLVHPEQNVQNAQKKVDQQLDKFKTEIINDFKKTTSRDVVDGALFVLGIVGLMANPISIPNIAAVFSAAGGASDFIYKHGERVLELYKPVGEAYKELYHLEMENKIASEQKCKNEGYKPKVAYKADGVPDLGKQLLVDLNNPKENQIVVIGE